MNGLLVALGVGALGGVGASIRFAVHRAVTRHDPGEFPLGTFIVNLVGAFLLGLLYGAHVGHDVMLIAGTGLLGGLTTFSTWMLETDRLAADGHPPQAVRNVLLSLALGLGAAALGVLLGGAF